MDQGEGWYTVINDNSGQSLDDYNWLTDNGANVVQWDALGRRALTLAARCALR